MILTLAEIIRDPGFPEGKAWRRYAVQANEWIIREGDEGDAFYLIEDGQIRVTGRIELEGNRLVQPGICDLDKGDFFGELGLFGTRTRSASVRAITDGKLLEINGKNLSGYLDAHPELGYRFLKELFMTVFERLERANHRVENLFAWGLKAHGITQHI